MGDDWASKTAQRLRDNEERQRQNEDAEMRREARLRSHAPLLWESLKESIYQKAIELNKAAYGQKLLTVSPLIEHRQNLEVEGQTAHLRLEFNEAVPMLTHRVTKQANTPYGSGGRSEGTFLLVVDHDQVWFINKGESGTYKSVEQTAEILLNSLLV